MVKVLIFVHEKDQDIAYPPIGEEVTERKQMEKALKNFEKEIFLHGWFFDKDNTRF